MPPPLHLDPAQVDFSRVVADQEGIRKFNPQRHEMEHLNGILFVDPSQHLVVGYKDVRPDEFWVRGHMPGYPLLPGALMCEAAAQLCSWYCMSQNIHEGDFVGFGGMENVRFRGPVRIGDRLLLVAKGIRVNRRQTVCSVQGFVDGAMVFNADVLGVPMSRSQEPGIRNQEPGVRNQNP